MAEYKRPTSEKEFENNFASIKPLMNETEAHQESARCLFCFDAPCIKACPTHIDIPLFIRQIHTGNKTGAAQTIYDANYLGNACGKVCPTEVLCEGACVYLHQKSKPVEIGRLQSYASNHAIQNRQILYDLPTEQSKRVAVIGAGPAGLSCACELRRYGFGVDIYEATSKPSGLTLFGVAPYKISNEEILQEVAFLQAQFGFSILYNHPVTDRYKITELESKYNAIFLGIGLGKTKSISLPGENLKNCHGATEFIAQLKMKHHEVKAGSKVIILGGGNTAMDAASEVARLGAEEVILAYRGSKENMGAYDFEYEMAKSTGVKGCFNISPVEILGKEYVTGVKFIKTQQDGMTAIPGSAFIESCDMLIRATGQEKQKTLLSRISGLTLDGNNNIVVNKKNYQTENPKYFAGGDAVNGGAEVVNAVAEGKTAAQGIIEFLKE